MAAIERQAALSPWSLSQFVEGSLKESQSSFVLDNGDGLLGFAIVQWLLDEATLMNIAVHPSQQGKGFGGLLLNAVLEDLRRRGQRRCLLEVRVGNNAAISLYRRHGFVEDGLRKGYYSSASGKEDALLMSCTLDGQA